MVHHVDAIYDNGVLKPVVPLSIPDKARVRLTVETQATDPAEADESRTQNQQQVRAALESSGLSEDQAVELFEAEKHSLRDARRASRP
jgi:predicted DNA-binding antitoxin AbrB/MazE fold protein